VPPPRAWSRTRVHRPPSAARGPLTWSAAEAEAYLASRAPLGVRFGLERIRGLVSVLGLPQNRFTSVHVVGTNGKTSVTEMTAALLEAHGARAGAYVSPHEERWSERIQIRGAEIDPRRFAAAVQRVAQAVEVVDRGLPDDESVTQFEVDTAAAFVALAAAGVEFGVIEAGLGGRLDATNVLPSRVTALTSIGLEHTEWLGDTEGEIAAEKLAVLRDHTTLVLGPVSKPVERLARRTAAERHSEIVTVRDLAPQVELASRAPYLRRDFAVALATAEAVLGRLDPAAATGVAATLDLHGRMEVREADPPLILDAAHNPDGARALAEALPAAVEALATAGGPRPRAGARRPGAAGPQPAGGGGQQRAAGPPPTTGGTRPRAAGPPPTGGRPVIACLAVLADKDVAGIVGALAPVVEGLVATEIPAERLAVAGRPGARTLAVSELAAASRGAGLGWVREEVEPAAAIARARDESRERAGVVLVTGSHYLLHYATE
jgi:dihydrofolate synthase / folylpolyglutamate synthase